MRLAILCRAVPPIALAFVVAVHGSTGQAAAQSAAIAPPASIDACLKQLQTLVEEAHAVDLLDDQIEQAETHVARMEKHCLASEFAEAMTAADEVRTILASNK